MANSDFTFMSSPFFTPRDRVGFANLVNPDKMSKKFDIELKITDSAAWKDGLKEILAFENEQRKARGLKPVKKLSIVKERDERTVTKDGKEVTYPGYTYIKAKRNPNKGQVPTVDSQNNPVDPKMVWRDSLCRLNIGVGFTESGVYTGIVLYLNGVQLLETAATESGGAGFSVDDDYAAVGAAGDTEDDATDDGYDFDEED